jgi:hypothetical protein
MFIGHYAAAFALRAGNRSGPPLWALAFSVQALDYVWAGLVLAGVEQVRVVPGHMAASDLDLFHMPWSHSLPAALAWSAVFGALWWAWAKRNPALGEARQGGALMAAGVFSHWLTDLLVHGPDLLLWPGGPKVGLGLWNSLAISQGLEVGLLLACVAAWAMARRSAGAAPGLLALFGGLALLLALQLVSHLPAPSPPSPQSLAGQALFAYSAITLLAWAMERAPRGGKAVSSGRTLRAERPD